MVGLMTPSRFELVAECHSLHTVNGAVIVFDNRPIDTVIKQWLDKHFGPASNVLGVTAVHGKFRIILEPLSD